MENKHLFLFEYVERNSRIIIYGLGHVGKEYIRQIEQTNWCEVVGVYDRQEIQVDNYPFVPIEQMMALKPDAVVIAVENCEVSLSIKERLIAKGIPKDIIYNMNLRSKWEKKQDIQVSGSKEKLYVTVIEGSGGIGDALIDLVFLNHLRMLLAERVHITFYCNYVSYIEQFDWIDEVKNYVKYMSTRTYIDGADLCIRMHRVAVIEYMDEGRVKQFSEKLYDFACDSRKTILECFNGNLSNYRITKYALLHGKNRIEQVDIHGILGVNRDTRFEMASIDGNKESEYIKDLLIEKDSYILVNRDTGSSKEIHTKLWPTEYYKDFLKMFKLRYPHIKVVMVGKRGELDLGDCVDINLLGQTTFEEIVYLLNNAKFLFSSEGGLVHVNHFLGGKSVVIFGPTDPEVYGYKENLNIYSESCRDACVWLTDNWDTKCSNITEHICMKSITPEVAICHIEEWIAE